MMREPRGRAAICSILPSANAGRMTSATFCARLAKGEVTVTPGKATTVTLRAYAAGTMPAFSVGAFAASPSLTPKVSVKTANEGDVLQLTLEVGADYVEEPGANIVYLYSQGKDYLTKRHLIVHAK